MPANVEAPAAKSRKPWLIALIILVCLALVAGIIAIVTGTADKEPAPKRAAVGDIITLGTFEQDDNRANGPEPIQWRVLARDGDRILVVSVYGLDRQLYDADEWNYDLWETCDLKAWLEDDFMQTAFTAEDRAAILEITCLSIEEATTLFTDDEDRICQATPYAKSQGVWLQALGVPEPVSAYWLLIVGSLFGRAGISGCNGPRVLELVMIHCFLGLYLVTLVVGIRL